MRKMRDGFLPTYIRFTEKLKEALGKEGVTCRSRIYCVQCWLVLEHVGKGKETEASSQVDALYAYWGRDYSTAIDSSEPRQVRAYQTLQDWNEQTEKR